jgi:imidazoleglycerol phosphate dehydratase HisB
MTNREQSLGYCLWTLFDHNVGIKRFIEIFRNLSKSFDEEREYANYEISSRFTEVLDYMDFEEDDISEMQSNLYHHFDMHTQEEAGRIFAFFTRGRPYMHRNLIWDGDRPRKPLIPLKNRSDDK